MPMGRNLIFGGTGGFLEYEWVCGLPSKSTIMRPEHEGDYIYYGRAAVFVYRV